MHYLLGLAALVMGAVIATRRTRPRWFVVLTSVLVAVGALLAILSYTRVTDSLGLTANNVIGWTFVGLSIITMLSSIFVLERRGEHGEELPPLIGDNPFDGDTDDSDDAAVGVQRPTSQDGVPGSDADVIPDDPAPSTAGGSAAHSAAARGAGTSRSAASFAGPAPTPAPTPTEGIMTDSTTPSGSHGDATPEPDDVTSHPGPSAGAQDGTTGTGTDPDIATTPIDSDDERDADGAARS